MIILYAPRSQQTLLLYKIRFFGFLDVFLKSSWNRFSSMYGREFTSLLSWSHSSTMPFQNEAVDICFLRTFGNFNSAVLGLNRIALN